MTSNSTTLIYDWDLYSVGLHFSFFLFLLFPLSTFIFWNLKLQNAVFVTLDLLWVMAKEYNFIHPNLTSFLFLYICHFQCWSKNIKAKSFNLKIHHRQITNHLNALILSHLYEVAEFILKFIQRLQPFTFISRIIINTANDKIKMTIKYQITGSAKVIYPKQTLMTFLYRYR